jgi:hemolysin activation/secretion protein
MNGTIMARGARYWTKITDSEFEDLGLDGERVLYEVKYRQPLIREYSHEFALSLGFTFIDGTTFVFENIGTPFGIGPDEDGVSRTSVVKLTQDFTQRGAERVWYLQSQINIGMDLFNATKNPNPIPDGRFVSWIGQGYIGQRIDKRQVLIIQGALQLSDDGLLASEQFVIGGAQSVRGYRQNMRIGDNGFRFSIEDRVSLVRDKAGNSIFDIRPFIDMGATWNVSDNPNEQQDKRFLLGAGVGVWASLGSLWEPLRDLWVRLDYGYPIIKMDDRGSNLQDKGFYFSINYEPNKILEKLF